MLGDRRIFLTALAVLAGLLAAGERPAAAQFYTLGEDPGGLRWSYVETPTYRVIYPRGLDSLGRVYAAALERAAGPAGGSIGIRPNAAYRNKMPAVLHPFTATANGQVTWTPRRVELLTVPDAFAPEATPWLRQLTIHESRHIAQLQAGADRPFRWLKFLSGQLAAGGVAALYGGPAFLEGDAVVAETALSASGRGRTADFLEYYRVSFAAGDFRDYWRWRYGSQRLYTPDYYRAGYLAVGGIRARYGVPDLSARFYRRIREHGGVAFLNWDKTVREATGKTFREAFAEVSAALQEQWAADEAARSPFMPSDAVSAVPRRFTEYSSLESAGDGLYAVRGGITRPDRLVRVGSDGTERPLTLLGTGRSQLRYSAPTGRLYWSEQVRDVRWPLRSWSVIRSADSGGVRTLTRKTRFFHPAPAPDAPVLAVTEYPADGSCRVLLLDAASGAELRSWRAPDGMQVVETAWAGGSLYASALTEEGFGLYRVEDFTAVLPPRPVKIKQLRSAGDALLFTCDLTGVNELYRLDPRADAAPQRMTATRFGASDFALLRDTLFYASLRPEGRLIRKTAVADLMPQEADFSQLPQYPFAEELRAGEPEPIGRGAETEVSNPRPYGKLAHLFRFHSWLPLYFAYDAVDNLSLETIRQSAGLGATAFWQNDLGSGSGFFGYHAACESGTWRHSAHAQLSYAGLYPVFELRADFNERDACDYRLRPDADGRISTLYAASRGVPALSGQLRSYIPWNFSSGGWLRGLVPSATLLLNNDRLGDGSPMTRASLSLRGYIMQRTPASRPYPRFGIGAEAGYRFRPGTSLIAPSGYAYLYGYLPGLHETHGLRWSLLGARRFGGVFSEAYAASAPRGYPGAVAQRIAAYPGQVKAAFDYKLPLLPVDRALLGPAAYLSHFELTLHGDWAHFRSAQTAGSLYSTGADLNAVLGNLLWIPYATRIGVSYNYNGGASFATFAAQKLPVERHVVSLIFSVEL